MEYGWLSSKSWTKKNSLLNNLVFLRNALLPTLTILKSFVVYQVECAFNKCRSYKIIKFCSTEIKSGTYKSKLQAIFLRSLLLLSAHEERYLTTICLSNISIIFISIIFHRTPINYLLVNLAIADVMYAAFIAAEVILRIAIIHPDGLAGTVLCKLVTAAIFAWIGAISSMVTLLVIAFERYFAVIYPYDNRRLTTKKLKVCHCVTVNGHRYE